MHLLLLLAGGGGRLGQFLFLMVLSWCSAPPKLTAHLLRTYCALTVHLFRLPGTFYALTTHLLSTYYIPTTHSLCTYYASYALTMHFYVYCVVSA